MAEVYRNNEPLERPLETRDSGLKKTNVPRTLIVLLMIGLVLVVFASFFFFNFADFV
jgi:hypothetical protein